MVRRLFDVTANITKVRDLKFKKVCKLVGVTKSTDKKMLKPLFVAMVMDKIQDDSSDGDDTANLLLDFANTHYTPVNAPPTPMIETTVSTTSSSSSPSTPTSENETRNTNTETIEVTTAEGELIVLSINDTSPSVVPASTPNNVVAPSMVGYDLIQAMQKKREETVANPEMLSKFKQAIYNELNGKDVAGMVMRAVEDSHVKLIEGWSKLLRECMDEENAAALEKCIKSKSTTTKKDITDSLSRWINDKVQVTVCKVLESGGDLYLFL
jgi:hypothetical protein